MSDSEAQQPGALSDDDLNGFKAEMVETAVGFVLYGVYATFSIITVYLFLARGLRSKARVVLFIVTIVMFLLSTCSLILDLEFNLLLFPTYSFNPPDPNVLAPLLIKLSIALNMFERATYFISDAIVVWRAWAFYPRSFFVKSILCICLLASAVGILTDTITGGVRRLRDFYDIGSPIDILQITVPLLVTNVVATSLIAYKAWCHRRTLKQNLDSSNSLTKVQKVLVLIVESGFIYCILWIIFTAVTLTTGFLSPSWQAYARALPMLSALYPVLIILLVSLENSKEDEANKPGMSLSQSMQFASAPLNVGGGSRGSPVDIESQRTRQASVNEEEIAEK